MLELANQLYLGDLQRNLDEVLFQCENCLAVVMILMWMESTGDCFADCWVLKRKMMLLMKKLVILMIVVLTLQLSQA